MSFDWWLVQVFVLHLDPQVAQVLIELIKQLGPFGVNLAYILAVFSLFIIYKPQIVALMATITELAVNKDGVSLKRQLPPVVPPTEVLIEAKAEEKAIAEAITDVTPQQIEAKKEEAVKEVEQKAEKEEKPEKIGEPMPLSVANVSSAENIGTKEKPQIAPKTSFQADKDRLLQLLVISDNSSCRSWPNRFAA